MTFHQASSESRKAAQILTLATLFWGVSFPVMKAIALVEAQLDPSISSWFVASSTMMLRFGLAGLITLIWLGRNVLEITRLELRQGFGLGLFAGLGMLFQMDGLSYTSASTSAFLTQSYCLFLPALAALRTRQRPSIILLACTIMVMTGIAVLARVDWRSLQMGRGEVETLISSLIFAGQILWLERPVFARNRVAHFTLVMFGTMAAICLCSALASMHHPREWRTALTSREVLGLTLILVTLCTLIAFVLMNRWQPVLSAPEAALIYAAEPVFASLFALFLPRYLSKLVGISYANEQLTANLLVGGGLITLANVMIQIQAARRNAPTEPVQLWGVGEENS